MEALAKELNEKYGKKYFQSLLSNFEGQEGPSLEIVEIYADYFKLKNEERFDFFLVALEISEKTEEIEFSKIDPIFLDMFRKFLAFILSDQDVGFILGVDKKYPHYFTSLIKNDNINWYKKNYGDLLNQWRFFFPRFDDFMAEAVKYHPRPDISLTSPKSE